MDKVIAVASIYIQYTSFSYNNLAFHTCPLDFNAICYTCFKHKEKNLGRMTLFSVYLHYNG